MGLGVAGSKPWAAATQRGKLHTTHQPTCFLRTQAPVLHAPCAHTRSRRCRNFRASAGRTAEAASSRGSPSPQELFASTAVLQTDAEDDLEKEHRCAGWGYFAGHVDMGHAGGQGARSKSGAWVAHAPGRPCVMTTCGLWCCLLCRLLRENRQRMNFVVMDDERCEPSEFEPQPEASSSGSGGAQQGCPVYVMLPLDTVWVVERDGKRVSVLKKERSLEIALHTLKQAGVEGVMVDVWWGIVERAGPRSYDFSAYQSLFRKVARAGLKVQAVMSFHAAGGNVGDTCRIALPKWVLDIGDKNPDIYYTDKSGHRNRECLSLGCDEEPMFWGRTPVEMYADFIEAFVEKFYPLFGRNATTGEGWHPAMCMLPS